jgi:hypothetical protein
MEGHTLGEGLEAILPSSIVNFAVLDELNRFCHSHEIIMNDQEPPMYNQQMLDLATVEIEAQIAAMASTYTSAEFYTEFALHYSGIYSQFIRSFTAREHDESHAIQLVNSQLMHTVNDKFSHLTRKVKTIPNPKGGDMSEWIKL